MVEIGLTGGIASGKSLVCGMLEELGARIIDADVLARHALEPGRPAFNRTVDAFGQDILKPDGGIDRPKLAGIIFADPAKRKLLESIVHPEVFAQEAALVEGIRGIASEAVVVFDAALLIESGAYARMDKVVVVWCRRETQLARLMARSGFTKEQAAQRVDSQMPLDDKRGYANFVIDNDGDAESTRAQVEKLYHMLKTP